VRVSEAAQRLIREKGGSVYVRKYEILNGCVVPNYEPVLAFGEPPAEEREHYTLYTVGDVKVYVHQNVLLTPELLLDTRRILGRDRLVLRGWKVF